MYTRKALIGVIHLQPIPHVDTRVEFNLDSIVEEAVKEAKAMERAGFTGVIVENYGDAPYRKRVRDPMALSAIAVVVREVVKSVSIDVGVNILRNSGLESYSVARVAGAKFIRVNALAETVVSDSGILEPEAPRLRVVRLNYPGIEVYADILVKHGYSLSFATARAETVGRSWEELVRELVLDYVERARADALIVTGLRTGEPPDLEWLRTVKKFSAVPVFVGSGVTPENLGDFIKYSDGVIVGSYIKIGGRAGNPLDPERLRAFTSAWVTSTGSSRELAR